MLHDDVQPPLCKHHEAVSRYEDRSCRQVYTFHVLIVEPLTLWCGILRLLIGVRHARLCDGARSFPGVRGRIELIIRDPRCFNASPLTDIV